MEYRQIGSSELRASVSGLGCNNFGGRLDREGTIRVVGRALDRGVNLFDTADSYGKAGGSEILLGEALGARRNEAIIATKFGWPLDASGENQGGSRRYVFKAVEASLKRLGTDRIDLYQFHQPDPQTPIEETLGALDELVKQGKVRYVGCSNFSAAQLAEAGEAAGRMGFRGFVSGQHHHNLLTRGIEADVIPELKRQGMSLIPYAPLASGLLTGKFRRGAPMPAESRIASSPKQADRYLSEANWQIIEDLVAFSEKRGRTLLELAVAWVVSNPTMCSVIAGAMSPEQVDANVDAAAWTLSADEIAEIDRIARAA